MTHPDQSPIAIAASLAAGIVYGLLHAAMINAVWRDPYQPSPGFAVLAPFAFGTLVGSMLLVLLLVVVWLFRRPGPRGCASVFASAGLFTAGWVVACGVTTG